MKMVIHLYSYTFETEIDQQPGKTEEETIKDFADKWYHDVDKLEKVLVELADGSFLVMGKVAVQKAIYVITK